MAPPLLHFPKTLQGRRLFFFSSSASYTFKCCYGDRFDAPYIYFTTYFQSECVGASEPFLFRPCVEESSEIVTLRLKWEGQFHV